MSEYCDISLITLQPINKNIARGIIEKNHYTHKWTNCTVAYGVYIKDSIQHEFFEGDANKLIGVIIYGNAVGRCASTSISPLLINDNVFELTRLWIEDGYGKNIESYCIAKSFELINKDFPKIKCILSYADSEA
ncbi:MAG: Polaribacter phage, partial [Bacteroidota bacterium]